MVKEMNLEDLLEQTEQKITNNEYYEDVTVEYKGYLVGVRIRPISQADFAQITRNINMNNGLEYNTKLIQKCVINKYDNKPFTIDQINKLFTGGLASAIAKKCLDVSGIMTSEDVKQAKEMIDF